MPPAALERGGRRFMELPDGIGNCVRIFFCVLTVFLMYLIMMTGDAGANICRIESV